MKDVSPIVGIDLGTTYSAIAIMKDGEVCLLPNALGDTLSPSAVAVDPRTNELVVGRVAKDLWVTHRDSAALAFKRDMGRPDTLIHLAGRKMSPSCVRRPPVGSRMQLQPRGDHRGFAECWAAGHAQS